MLASRWKPRHKADAIKPQQAKLGPQPQIAVRGLSKSEDTSLQLALSPRPARMGILRDAVRRFESTQRTA